MSRPKSARIGLEFRVESREIMSADLGTTPPTRVRFDVWELDLRSRELITGSRKIRLNTQPFRLLHLLLKHAGTITTREQIQSQLWADGTNVDFEHGINVAVRTLRRELADSTDNPRYIETIPRLGYRFLIPAEWLPDPSGEHLTTTRPEEDEGKGGMPAAYSGASEATPKPQSPAEQESIASALAQPKPQSQSRRLAFLISVVVIVAMAGFFYRSHRINALTDKDSIVVAEFGNDTGDSVFDETLRQGLSAQLEQSPFLNLVSDARVARALSLMSQPKEKVLTPSLAHEVCLRTGSAATIEGSIARLGSHYVLGIKALDCRTGDELADEQVVANDKDHVLTALGRAATSLRKKLGESLSSVQKYDVPLEDVTTPSLDALDAYSRGYRALNVDDYPDAISLAKRATALDPNFAAAYMLQGIASRDMGDNKSAAANVSTAYNLRSRVSERERLNIESMYAAFVTGDMEAARREHKIWAQLYAHDSIPPARLANIDLTMGDYEEAIIEYRTALSLDPENAMQYVNLANAYTLVNRPDQAEVALRDAEARHVNLVAVDDIRYSVAFLRHDTSAMDGIASRLLKKPNYADQILNFESDGAAYTGHLGKARELSEAAIASAEHEGEIELAAGYAAESALRDALAGDTQTAKQQARRALSMSDVSQVEAVAAIALALAGEAEQSERVAADLTKRFPLDTAVQFDYLPVIHTAAVLSRDAAKALHAIAPAQRYELGWMGNNLDFNGYPVYFRAEALLANHQGAAAGTEFQKIIDHPGVVLNEPIAALAWLGLGRSFAMSGDTEKAKAAYQDFLSLWKEADPDTPIYEQAKAEYANLR